MGPAGGSEEPGMPHSQLKEVSKACRLPLRGLELNLWKNCASLLLEACTCKKNIDLDDTVAFPNTF